MKERYLNSLPWSSEKRPFSVLCLWVGPVLSAPLLLSLLSSLSFCLWSSSTKWLTETVDTILHSLLCLLELALFFFTAGESSQCPFSRLEKLMQFPLRQWWLVSVYSLFQKWGQAFSCVVREWEHVWHQNCPITASSPQTPVGQGTADWKDTVRVTTLQSWRGPQNSSGLTTSFCRWETKTFRGTHLRSLSKWRPWDQSPAVWTPTLVIFLRISDYIVERTGIFPYMPIYKYIRKYKSHPALSQAVLLTILTSSNCSPTVTQTKSNLQSASDPGWGSTCFTQSSDQTEKLRCEFRIHEKNVALKG